MMMVGTVPRSSPRYICHLGCLASLVIFQFLTVDAFSTIQSTSFVSPVPCCSLRPGGNCQFFRLSAVKSSLKGDKPKRSYDLISVEEADKILESERLEHEEELIKLKGQLEIQCEQLRELDCRDPEVEFLLHGDCGGSVGGVEDDSIDDKFFSSPYATTIDEDEYKQLHQNSHDAAQRRTIEIALRHLYDENEEMENELKNQRESYQNYIDEIQEAINDNRDRAECMQEELKIEHSHFERANAELEEVINQERSKVRELEERLLIARREQEILEEAAIEAHHREQERQQQEEHEREQRQLEREIEEHQRQEHIRKEEERQRHAQLQKEEEHQHQEQLRKEEEQMYHEQLLREHQELAELEKRQEEFNKVYLDIFNDSTVGDTHNGNYNPDRNLNQPQEEVVGVGGGPGPQKYQYHEDSVTPQAPSSSHYTQYDMGQQTATVIPQTIDPPQAKRESRINSHAHGIFMNFNDMLM